MCCIYIDIQIMIKHLIDLYKFYVMAICNGNSLFAELDCKTASIHAREKKAHE